MLHSIDLNPLDLINRSTKDDAINALETGNVLYLPSYAFKLEPNESRIVLTNAIQIKHKNVSYDFRHHQLSGINHTLTKQEDAATLQVMMHRFAHFSHDLIHNLLPSYHDSLQWGRTSYRPIEIEGRARSKRQDDTRLHVDSFPSTPTQGLRILRVFYNINPNEKPRTWHLGEPFETVLDKFSPNIPAFNAMLAKSLHWLKLTKSLRSAYDHYMLKLHDSMKLDDNYQQNVAKHRVDFPANSTWIVYTDQVSHAALSGQFLLEQTFYLPVTAMQSPEHSPLWQWEAHKQCLLT